MNTWDEPIEGSNNAYVLGVLGGLPTSGFGIQWTQAHLENNQQGENNLRLRLDRAVANDLFSNLFNEAYVENIITTTSDHYVVRLVLAKASDEHEYEKGSQFQI